MTARLPVAFAANLGRPLRFPPPTHSGRHLSTAARPAAAAGASRAPPPPTMGLHAALCLDAPAAAATRAANRAAHLEWVAAPPLATDVDGAGRIAVDFGGPLLGADGGGPVGSLLLVDGTDVAAVEAALTADPYAKAGLFASVTVRSWRRGMASEAPLPGALYAVYCVDKGGQKPLRAATRPAHLEWWKASGRAGMIGPFPEGDGAVGTLIIVDGASKADVTAWAATDPYAKAGLFASVTVWPMKKVVEGGKVLV